MGLIFAAIVAVLTVAAALLILFADGMSDAPQEQGVMILPTLLTGFGIAGVLAASHFVHVSW